MPPSRPLETSLITHLLLAAVLLVACPLVGCKPSQPIRENKTLIVFAAASLGDAFGAIEKDFEQEHPAIDVQLSFAGSQSLRTQIENGAQPNVFASANQPHMQALLDGGLTHAPEIFARNQMVIVVPADNPAGIRQLADLPKAERLVLAGASVPAGVYASQILDSAAADPAYGDDFAERVAKRVVSRETHVRQTLQKVVLGEADAALVYATDARSVGDKVQRIPIPREHSVIAHYPIAPLRDASYGKQSLRFVEHVLSEAGRARLAEHGFLAPRAD